MLRVLNNEQLKEIETKEAEVKAAIQTESQAVNPVVSSLAAYIRKCWEEAKQAKIPIFEDGNLPGGEAGAIQKFNRRALPAAGKTFFRKFNGSKGESILSICQFR